MNSTHLKKLASLHHTQKDDMYKVEIIEEVHDLCNKYNEFVKTMDEKIDKILSRLGE